METQVVTSENLDAFNAQKMGLTQPVSEETPKTEEVKAPEEAKTEVEATEKVEETTETEEEEHKEPEKPKKSGKPINERFSELTAQKKAAMARAEDAERRIRELEEKVKATETKASPVDPDAKPNPDTFKDAFAYAEALASWSANQAIKQERIRAETEKTKSEQQQMLDSWNKRVIETEKEIPDYREIVSDSSVQVSDAVRDAIFESDIGPKLIHHLALNPEVAEKLSSMKPARAVLELGKLEASLTKSPSKPTLSEISKAPAPISPVKGAAASAGPIGADGEFHGSFEEYKAARLAGKIK
jgi:hypothetical protein